jgi:hypothetical protein
LKAGALAGVSSRRLLFMPCQPDSCSLNHDHNHAGRATWQRATSERAALLDSTHLRRTQHTGRAKTLEAGQDRVHPCLVRVNQLGFYHKSVRANGRTEQVP